MVNIVKYQNPDIKSLPGRDNAHTQNQQIKINKRMQSTFNYNYICLVISF